MNDRRRASTTQAISRLEQTALKTMRALRQRERESSTTALNAILEEYDRFVTADRVDLSGPSSSERRSKQRPWEQCQCDICRAVTALKS